MIMTAHSDLESAVSAYQGGAFEYLPKPFDVNEAVDLVRRACKMRHERDVSKDTEAAVNLLSGGDMICLLYTSRCV